jgi:hypothetical protein
MLGRPLRLVLMLLALLGGLIMLQQGAAAAQPAAQSETQVPGFYRVKVGAFEVTALCDGAGVFSPNYLHGPPPKLQRIIERLHADPHLSAGDVVVQQATRHGWRNRGDRPATILFVTLGTTR